MRLEAGENWQDLNLVFPNRKGGFLQQKVDYSRWIRALSSCNIPIRRLHDARHTAGTLLFAHGEGIETIRRFLGHSTVNLTSKTYVHNADAPMKSAAQTLNKVLGKVDIA
jgi:integrase